MFVTIGRLTVFLKPRSIERSAFIRIYNVTSLNEIESDTVRSKIRLAVSVPRDCLAQ